VDINAHPIWDQITPYHTKISPFKKPFHLLRILLARQVVKFFPKDLFIGISGSVGKTTCLMISYEILSRKFKTVSTKTNLDPVLNIPRTILSLTPFVQKVLLEMGIEYPGEMDFYLSIVKPRTAIITKISYAHSQFLGNIEQIAREKGKLIEQLPKEGLAILNWDDYQSRKLAQKCRANILYFGTDEKNCAVWASNIKIEDFRTSFELNLGVERVKINYGLLGRHQVYPALAAATLGVSLDIPLTKIKLALEQIKPVRHRLEPIIGPSGSYILDDTHNSSPAAVEGAIDTLVEIPARRRILVLGEMRELGPYSEMLHRQIAQKIFKEKIDLVFLGTGEAKYITDELKNLGFWDERIESNLQNSQIVNKLLKILGKGDICLIKGSRAVRLDEVIDRITKDKQK
jgi:UDP-N-acetylmuramoyl-tripeptide--D-alanyl-D-alanine ligase